MEDWRKVWRDGFAPLASSAGLLALRDALLTDNQQLHQGCTTTPPPLQCVEDWPCEGACALSFMGWKGSELATVGEVEKFFNKACYDADQRIGEVAACRWFLNWFDDTPRDIMRHELLAEVELALANRQVELPPVSAMAS